MTEISPYSHQPGDVVNGHILGSDNAWHPVQQIVPQQYAQPAPPQFAPPQVVVNQINQRSNRTSHGLHLFLSIITFGLWVPVWIIVTIVNRGK